MIQTKLLLIEYDTVNDINVRQEKLDAIKSIKNLLSHIDFNSEIVPLNKEQKLKNLLSSLKGSILTAAEIKVVKELISNKS